MRQTSLALAMIIAVTTPVTAAPANYVLEPEASSVGFETDFGPDHITGKMPVTRADLTIDFDKVANSTVAVTLDVQNAEASFPFAAQAMKGPKVLDARSYPEITFASTAVRPSGRGQAKIDGNLTIRGVTKPVTFDASIWRQQGTETGDLSRLTIRMTAAVDRSDFGATGWSDMVSNQVRLDIVARISRVK
jgi:polyisoprenoid-binding protein YceI